MKEKCISCIEPENTTLFKKGGFSSWSERHSVLNVCKDVRGWWRRRVQRCADKAPIIWMSNGAFGTVCERESQAVSCWKHTMQILPITPHPPHTHHPACQPPHYATAPQRNQLCSQPSNMEMTKTWCKSALSAGSHMLERCLSLSLMHTHKHTQSEKLETTAAHKKSVKCMKFDVSINWSVVFYSSCHKTHWDRV